jgi:hypothetical protein
MRLEPDCFRVTRAGLALIGSELPAPQFDPRYRHDVESRGCGSPPGAEHGGRLSAS